MNGKLMIVYKRMNGVQTIVAGPIAGKHYLLTSEEKSFAGCKKLLTNIIN